MDHEHFIIEIFMLFLSLFLKLLNAILSTLMQLLKHAEYPETTNATENIKRYWNQ